MAGTKTRVFALVEYIDLLTDKNQIVRIEVPPDHIDDFYDYISEAVKSDDWLCSGRYDGVTMKLNGTLLSRIHMSRIVGML